MTQVRYFFRCLLLLFCPTVCAASSLPSGEAECGRMNPEGANIGIYGPFDYYRPKEPNAVHLVESAHFTRDVEQLRKGNTAADPAGDLRYTLLALPNHPRALQTLVLLARKENTNRPKNMVYSVECYFDRALRFRPNDNVVKLIFGNYLATTGRYPSAKAMLESARETMEGNANYHYNLGLVNVAMKEWDEAVSNAAIAYLRGFNLPGLKKKLSDVGKWGDVERKMIDSRSRAIETIVPEAAQEISSGK